MSNHVGRTPWEDVLKYFSLYQRVQLFILFREANEVAPRIIYKPSSMWVQPESEYFVKPLSYPEAVTPLQGRLHNLRADPKCNTATLEKLIEEMDIPDFFRCNGKRRNY